jgi:hypothetical protein
MEGADVKDQLLQLYGVEKKKCSKRYMTLYETLPSVAVHKSVLSSKAIYCLTLRHLLTKGLGEKLGSIVPCPVCGYLSTEPPPKRDFRLLPQCT